MVHGVGRTRKLRLIVDRAAALQGEALFTRGTSYAELLSLCRTVCSTFQNNYPEVLKSAVVLPVSPLFRGVFALFSHLVKPSSRRKIVLLSESSGQWWGQEFPAHTIPVRMGGTFQKHLER